MVLFNVRRRGLAEQHHSNGQYPVSRLSSNLGLKDGRTLPHWRASAKLDCPCKYTIQQLSNQHGKINGSSEKAFSTYLARCFDFNCALI